ncbi:MAG TPA: tyrosine-type recombinase/integrase [Xanthobacteraceae bacterium]|nr:tyrosine-type recombinase/integrase [Xanthobacteraceae bacterium]
MGKRVYRRITDGLVEAARDFGEGATTVIWDIDAPGLHVRIGKRRITWSFQREHAIRGKRGTTFKRLGYFPIMKVVGARKKALIEAGHVASGNVIAGRKSAAKFSVAIDRYIQRTRVRGKSEDWSKDIKSLKNTHLKDFLNWTLPELSAAPNVVNDWHLRITDDNGLYIANQAARVLRAIYNRERKLDPNLPANNPCSAVEFNPEQRSQKGMSFADFPKWKRKWDAIKSPSRQAFQLANLLTGLRPGELARLKWSDVFPLNPETGKRMPRSFIVRDAKARNDFYPPLSSAICRALQMARDARSEDDESEWVFPGRTSGSHITSYDDDGLPAYGKMNRHVWRTVAADLKIDELICEFCQGHVPKGMSRGYVLKLTLASGQAMREAQRKVSRRVVTLLGIKL